ncbi:MAG: hypothetical protein ACYDIE_06180 [Candidatus Krumholzibacteriia bacterium]
MDERTGQESVESGSQGERRSWLERHGFIIIVVIAVAVLVLLIGLEAGN